MKIFLIFLLNVFFCVEIIAQKQYSLQEIIGTAKKQSIDYQRLVGQRKIAYWQYKYANALLLPQVKLAGEVPHFERNIEIVKQNDGSEVPRSVSLSTSSVELSISQSIYATGGVLFVSSRLGRIDILSNAPTTSYLSYPVLVGIRQPLFGFNSYRYSFDVEKLHKREADKQYLENIETLSLNATKSFFGALILQEQVKILKKSASIADTLYGLNQKRFELGRITQAELLQSELNTLTIRQSLQKNQYELENQLSQLKIYLNETQEIKDLDVPKLFEFFEIDKRIALEQARKNRSKIVALQKRLMEAKKQLAQARGNAGFNANIIASFGLSGTAPSLPTAYANPQGQQGVSITFELPLLDWKKGKADVKIALTQLDITEAEIKQQEQQLDQEVGYQIQQWELAQKSIEVSLKSQKITQYQLQVAQNDYLNGKISYLDFSRYLLQNEETQKNYLYTLQNYWEGYYKIRLLTLYDFEKNQPIGGEPYFQK